MPGSLPVQKIGPISYQVSGLVVGGQLVVPTGTTGTAAPAAPSAQTIMANTTANCGSDPSGSTAILGVAASDANVLTQPGLPGNITGYPPGYDQAIDLSVLGDYIAVYLEGVFNVFYEATVNFGQKLIAGAAGGVKPAGSAPDMRTVIGICVQPGGVVVSGSAVLAEAYISVI